MFHAECIEHSWLLRCALFVGKRWSKGDHKGINIEIDIFVQHRGSSIFAISFTELLCQRSRKKDNNI